MQFNIYWANLNPVQGREQAGHRPVLIISNDIENQLDIITIIPITSKRQDVKSILKSKICLYATNQHYIYLSSYTSNTK